MIMAVVELILVGGMKINATWLIVVAQHSDSSFMRFDEEEAAVRLEIEDLCDSP